MGLLNKVFKIISGNNENLNEVNIDKARFLKDFSMENKQLKDLELLAGKLKDGEKKDKVNRNIYYQKQGLYGEKKVYFELKNTFLPIICLHDIRIEYEDYIAQLDFVVISSRYICVLEAKKLNGNIRIDSNGDFIRRFNNGNEQGMYSPISQNKRHINVLKYVLSKELNIDIPFESLVILANEKSIIDQNKAPEETKNCIVKHDGAISRLEKLQKENKVALTLQDMNNIGKLLIKLNKLKAYNNLAKFSIVEKDFINPTDIKQFEMNNNENIFKQDGNKLFEKLRVYRNEKAKEEGYKPISYHCVFPNVVIEQIVENMPDSIEELYYIKGLGKVKIDKYGQDIINILKGKSKGVKSTYKTNLIQKAASEIAADKFENVQMTREQLTQELKKFRLEKSKQLKIKPYFIFNNAEMEELLDKIPKNKSQLLKVRGFGEKKVEQYGERILEILKN
ncbi:HRDC domain-containing protein [Clostridium aestuarii]|uniref:HRDC domain-containing protein n=1 Tax=Clostridium aestuarii TaxID=338193 RepID=A0ABT4CVI6_9CLOT|nr:HRDC domain-containing protein [Clostridium aestuarii]MCY6483000.1 HRDC domain-containing protein [Clostridium aestuarii]